MYLVGGYDQSNIKSRKIYTFQPYVSTVGESDYMTALGKLNIMTFRVENLGC